MTHGVGHLLAYGVVLVGVEFDDGDGGGICLGTEGGGVRGLPVLSTVEEQYIYKHRTHTPVHIWSDEILSIEKPVMGWSLLSASAFFFFLFFFFFFICSSSPASLPSASPPPPSPSPSPSPFPSAPVNSPLSSPVFSSSPPTFSSVASTTGAQSLYIQT